MIKKYRYHSIEIKESGTISYSQGQRVPPDYVHNIEGHFFASYDDGGYTSGFKTPDEALIAAQKITDLKFEHEELKANLRCYLVEQDFEYFTNYLKLRRVPNEQIPTIASTLTLASTQKEVSTEKLHVEIDGYVEANVSGNVSTES